jgi:hypothetical protein
MACNRDIFTSLPLRVWQLVFEIYIVLFWIPFIRTLYMREYYSVSGTRYIYDPSTLFFSLWLYSPLNLGRLFSFLIIYTVGRISWMGDQPIVRLLPIHRTTQTQNKRKQTSVPRVGFEPTTSVFERAETIYALGCIGTVICSIPLLCRSN